MTSQAVSLASIDPAKAASLCERLRASDRVKVSVKQKTDAELLAHYGLVKGKVPTNLGVLLVGRAQDRAGLGSAPIVQAIKYDEREVKVSKWSWDDHELSPIDLVDAIWTEVPDFREGMDSVHVTVPRRVVQPGIIKLLVEADQRYQLMQRERITLALVAQTEGISAAELAERLELPEAGALGPWLGRLVTLGLINQSGRTKAVARALEALLSEGTITATGERRWRKYRLADDKRHAS